MADVLVAWIPLATPSMNSLLYCVRGRHEAKPDVRLFRSQLKSYLPVWCLASTGPYSLSLGFHEPWYVKSGYPKKKDVQNLTKVCVDTVAERYGFDDSLIWKVSSEKIPDTSRVGITMTLRSYDVEPSNLASYTGECP